jgi:hypothetical protein
MWVKEYGTRACPIRIVEICSNLWLPLHEAINLQEGHTLPTSLAQLLDHCIDLQELLLETF